MSPRNVTLVSRLVPGMVLGLLVLILLVLLGDMRQVTHLMQAYDWRYLPLVLLLTLFNYSIRFIKWHFSIGRTGVKSLSIINSAQLFMAAFPLTVSQGKVSHALKGIWLNQKSGMPAGRSNLILAADQVSDWLAVLALSILGVIAYPAYWPVFLFVLIVLLAIIVFNQEPASSDAWRTLEKQIPALSEYMLRLRQSIFGGLSVYRLIPGIVAFMLGVISWLLEGLCLFLILLGTGLEPSYQLLVTAIWIVVLSTLIGALTGMPGGLGAIEVALATTLTLFTGLAPAVATIATVLFRLSTLWFKVIIGLVVWRFSPGLTGLRSQNGTIVEG
jgi:glycosyltransferase 2 family protein